MRTKRVQTDISVTTHVSVTAENKRLPLWCQEVNALMTFNMPCAFLINVPFNIMLLMCALCMQDGAHKHHLMLCAHMPSGNPGKCQKVFWAMVRRHHAAKEEKYRRISVELYEHCRAWLLH